MTTKKTTPTNGARGATRLIRTNDCRPWLKLAGAALLALLANALLLPASFAGVSVDTYERPKAFEPDAPLSANDRAIELTFVTEPGPPCRPGMTEHIEVVVVQ